MNILVVDNGDHELTTLVDQFVSEGHLVNWGYVKVGSNLRTTYLDWPSGYGIYGFRDAHVIVTTNVDYFTDWCGTGGNYMLLLREIPNSDPNSGF